MNEQFSGDQMAVAAALDGATKGLSSPMLLLLESTRATLTMLDDLTDAVEMFDTEQLTKAANAIAQRLAILASRIEARKVRQIEFTL